MLALKKKRKKKTMTMEPLSMELKTTSSGKVLEASLFEETELLLSAFPERVDIDDERIVKKC